MNLPRYSALAARLLRREMAAVNDRQPPLADEKPRGLLTIQRAFLARRRRQIWLRVAALSSLAAALVLGLVGLRALAWPQAAPSALEPGVQVNALPRGAGASIIEQTERKLLRAGDQLSAGSRIETGPGGGVSLRLSTGTRLTLDDSAGLTLLDQGLTQRFSLVSGVLSAEVAKLAAGERFVVDTPDAEVEVRGTQFRLRVLPEAEECEPGIRTRLSVIEGVVEVRAQQRAERIGAGGHWPAACGDPALANEPPSAAAVQPAVRAAERTPAPERVVSAGRSANEGSGAGVSVEVSPSSGLSEQNQLFAEAGAAQRAGNWSGALGVYERLIRQYPSSALAENAMVERMRLLAGSDAAGAKREATRYLRRYPKGFDRLEAERFLAAP